MVVKTKSHDALWGFGWTILLTASFSFGCSEGSTSPSNAGGAPAAGAGSGNGDASAAAGTSSGGAAAGAGGIGGGGIGGAFATGGTSSVGGTSPTSDLLVPAQGALFGAFVGTGTVPELETTLGRQLAILHNFFGWSDDWMARVPGDLASGKIPLITWETWNSGVGVPLDDVISGVHDTMIVARASAAKNAGQKFFLRWGHEMNGNWYPWSGFSNGANAAATAKYIAAYRHIHDLFVSAGATNVLWVFSPNVDSVPGDAWNQWLNYYPGDAYVDWLGFDGYNWGTAQTWQSFTAIASRIYPGLAAKNKPIMIPETASTELGGDKAAWIAAVVPALESSYPNVKAFVWFHMNKEQDWRLDSSATASSAAVAMTNDSYLNP